LIKTIEEDRQIYQILLVMVTLTGIMKKETI